MTINRRGFLGLASSAFAFFAVRPVLAQKDDEDPNTSFEMAVYSRSVKLAILRDCVVFGPEFPPGGISTNTGDVVQFGRGASDVHFVYIKGCPPGDQYKFLTNKPPQWWMDRYHRFGSW